MPRIDPDGTITTLAGDGHIGSVDDGGPASRARSNSPHGLALAPDGMLFVADTNNHRVCAVHTDGTNGTVAGNGRPGASGDGGPAARARFNSPHDVAVAADGSLVVADSFNDRVHVVDPNGRLRTVAGRNRFGGTRDGDDARHAVLGEPRALALRPDGGAVVGDYFHGRLRLIRDLLPTGPRPLAEQRG